jgi:DNA-binding NarL/FixJ family response regulator
MGSKPLDESASCPPESKILFISQESFVDVVQEAIALGALGYVVKAQAGSELLAAVEAVLEGRQFISSGVSGLTFTDNVDAQNPDHLYREEPRPSFALEKAGITRSHDNSSV